MLNEDILHDVYSRLGVLDLQVLRLVNRQSNAVTSCYLCRTIVIRPRRSTLEKITRKLSFIILGCRGMDAFDDPPGALCYLFYELHGDDYDETPCGPILSYVEGADNGTGCRASQPVDWMQTVDACQQLQALKGLINDEPMMYWLGSTWLCEGDGFEEVAMNGRVNCLRE